MKSKRRRALYAWRAALFLAIAFATGYGSLALAQPRRGTRPPPPRGHATKDGGADDTAPPPPSGRGDVAPAYSGPKGSASGGGVVVETSGRDGGSRTFRFGEMEIEGRLRSPQIVYFLRRVRAEFAAGDLGHRTFMRELSETRKDPSF